MKCKKLTFVSPLNGSVYCEGLVNEDDNRVDFGPYGVLQLYTRDERVLLGLTEQCAELKSHVPDELKHLVVSAVFGNTVELNGGLYLSTEIYVRKDLTEPQQELLGEWIVGQLSDGWGERFDQFEFLRETVTFNRTVFDEDTIEFGEEEERYTASYFIHPWQYGPKWTLELTPYYEDVNIDVEEDDRIAELQEAVEEMKRQIRELDVAISNLI